MVNGQTQEASRPNELSQQEAEAVAETETEEEVQEEERQQQQRQQLKVSVKVSHKKDKAVIFLMNQQHRQQQKMI